MAKMQTNEQGFGHDAQKNRAVAVREPEPVEKSEDSAAADLLDDLADDPLGDMLSADVDGIDEDSQNPAGDDETTVITAEEMLPAGESEQTYLKQQKTEGPCWYVVYTYAGYEKRVMANILKTAQNRDKEKTIIDVKVPEIETKDDKGRNVMRKLYPGYVMVKMYLTDQSWNLVRNTRGVTGFVGPASNPIPLSESEVRAMGIENVRIDLDVQPGDNIRVTGGPFSGFSGEVEDVDAEKQTVRVRVKMFNEREVPMDLGFALIKKA